MGICLVHSRQFPNTLFSPDLLWSKTSLSVIGTKDFIRARYQAGDTFPSFLGIQLLLAKQVSPYLLPTSVPGRILLGKARLTEGT